MTTFRSLLILATCASAAACMDVSGRIAGELMRYGLDEQRAECVGERLEADLSADQLRQLAAAARAYGRGDTQPQRLDPGDLLRVASEFRDPAVPLAVGRAGVSCGLRLSDVL